MTVSTNQIVSGISGFTAEQTEATQDLISGAWTESPILAASTVTLPSSVTYALWFPLNDGSGTTVTDRVVSKSANVLGTTTNLWDNTGAATLNADTRISLINDSYSDSLFRLDTLNGSILWGMELEGGTPSASIMLFGYGDNGNNAVGGISFRIDTSNLSNIGYCAVGGTTFKVLDYNLASYVTPKLKRFWQFALHRINGKVWLDCYESGWHHYSCRVPLFESNPYTIATAQGLRIGARPVGASGLGGNYVGAGLSLPKISNFYAMRIDADKRAYIPSWQRALARSLPYNVFPEL